MKKVQFLLVLLFTAALFQACKQIEECPAVGSIEVSTQETDC